MNKKILLLFALLAVCFALYAQHQEKHSSERILYNTSHWQAFEQTGSFNIYTGLYDLAYYDSVNLQSCFYRMSKYSKSNAGQFLYLGIKSFYETCHKKPESFAQWLAVSALECDTMKHRPIAYATLGWEFLYGHMVERDTLKGMRLMSLHDIIPIKGIPPCWRDSILCNQYKYKLDSTINRYNSLNDKPDDVRWAIIENGDTCAYERFKKSHTEYFMYSVYMADVYHYAPAYDDIYQLIMTCFNDDKPAAVVQNIIDEILNKKQQVKYESRTQNSSDD